MDNERIMLGALIFILIIVGANALMYSIVRGVMKGGESKWMSSIRRSLNKPWEGPANKDMDELRKRMEELQGKDGEKKE